MAHVIRPEELPQWVPGEVLQSSDGRDWRDIYTRTYRYGCLDVEVPALTDFMLVSYRNGSTRVDRRFEGRWTEAQCHPGDFSLLTRSQPSHWRWTSPVDVTHVYVSSELVARLAAEVFERPMVEVRLNDLLQAQDGVVNGIVTAIVNEIGDPATGGGLYIDALGVQLVVHLLRRYASVEPVSFSARGQLAPALRRRLVDHIEARLDQDLTLKELADIANMGVWNFSKHFRASFQTSPHQYIVERRVERAHALLSQDRLPVKTVAFMCGFSDQAHLTRAMRARLGCTPAALRKGASAQ